MEQLNVKNIEVKRGDIYWCNMGSIDTKMKGEQANTRPVIILQNNLGNKFSPTVIVACITSKVTKYKKVPTHVLIDTNTGLNTESVVLLEQIYTVNKSRLGDFIGCVNKEILKQIDEARNVSLGTIRPIDKLHTEVKEFIKKQLNKIYSYEEVISESDDNIIDILLNKRENLLKELDNYCKSKGYDYHKFYKTYNERYSA